MTIDKACLYRIICDFNFANMKKKGLGVGCWAPKSDACEPEEQFVETNLGMDIIQYF